MAELTALEKQISGKLQSNEPIDVEYWEQLLKSVGVYKAKSELHTIYESVIQSRLDIFKREQGAEAANLGERLQLVLEGHTILDNHAPTFAQGITEVQHSQQLDPEPELKLRAEDKNLEVLEEERFLDGLVRTPRASLISRVSHR